MAVPYVLKNKDGQSQEGFIVYPMGAAHGTQVPQVFLPNTSTTASSKNHSPVPITSDGSTGGQAAPSPNCNNRSPMTPSAVPTDPHPPAASTASYVNVIPPVPNVGPGNAVFLSSTGVPTVAAHAPSQAFHFGGNVAGVSGFGGGGAATVMHPGAASGLYAAPQHSMKPGASGGHPPLGSLVFPVGQLPIALPPGIQGGAAGYFSPGIIAPRHANPAAIMAGQGYSGQMYSMQAPPGHHQSSYHFIPQNTGSASCSNMAAGVSGPTNSSINPFVTAESVTNNRYSSRAGLSIHNQPGACFVPASAMQNYQQQQDSSGSSLTVLNSYNGHPVSTTSQSVLQNNSVSQCTSTSISASNNNNNSNNSDNYCPQVETLQPMSLQAGDGAMVAPVLNATTHTSSNPGVSNGNHLSQMCGSLQPINNNSITPSADIPYSADTGQQNASSSNSHSSSSGQPTSTNSGQSSALVNSGTVAASSESNNQTTSSLIGDSTDYFPFFDLCLTNDADAELLNSIVNLTGDGEFSNIDTSSAVTASTSGNQSAPATNPANAQAFDEASKETQQSTHVVGSSLNQSSATSNQLSAVAESYNSSQRSLSSHHQQHQPTTPSTCDYTGSGSTDPSSSVGTGQEPNYVSQPTWSHHQQEQQSSDESRHTMVTRSTTSRSLSVSDRPSPGYHNLLEQSNVRAGSGNSNAGHQIHKSSSPQHPNNSNQQSHHFVTNQHQQQPHYPPTASTNQTGRSASVSHTPQSQQQNHHQNNQEQQNHFATNSGQHHHTPSCSSSMHLSCPASTIANQQTTNGSHVVYSGASSVMYPAVPGKLSLVWGRLRSLLFLEGWADGCKFKSLYAVYLLLVF